MMTREQEREILAAAAFAHGYLESSLQMPESTVPPRHILSTVFERLDFAFKKASES